jgi:hypothetical protein
MKGDFWMKTRKLAAKALSAALLATTVSGYALAGDHSISADPSWEWCTKTYGEEVTNGTNGKNNGSCSATDWEIEFSGKLGGGWSYFFEIDPSGNGSSAASVGTINLTKDLGNGLTLDLGDTGDGSRESLGGHWDIIDGAGGNGEGGIKVSYSKGAINASAVYGAKSYVVDTGDSSISVGADYTMSGAVVGFSYHTTTPSAEKALHGGTQATSGYVISAGWANKSFAVGFDMTNAEEKACATAECGSDQLDGKATQMEINAATLTGAFRAGFSYNQSKDDVNTVATTDDTEDTTMVVQGRWYPSNWPNSHMRAGYTSFTSKTGGTKSETASYSKITVSVNTSASIL